MAVYHGRTATLIAGIETAFRVAATTPVGQLLKFGTLTIGQEAVLQDDFTINANALAEKRTEMDSTATATVNGIFCLNDIGWWLNLLLGPPVTTGAGPLYTHTYTLDLTDRPSAWLEMALGGTGDERYHRFIGMMVNQMSWDAMANEQRFTANLIGAVEVKPFPSAPLDATPNARYAKRQTCTKRANVYDVLGASTLGKLNALNIQFANDLVGYGLADGIEGFGCITLGQPAVTGSMGGLFTPDTFVDDALTHTTKRLVVVQADESGTRSMTTTVPNIEFDRPQLNINSSRGIVVDGLPWRAHSVAGAAPVTVVLVNDVAEYV